MMFKIVTYEIDFQTFVGKIYRLEEYLKMHYNKDENILDYINLNADVAHKVLIVSHKYGNPPDNENLVFIEKDLNNTAKVGLTILGFAYSVKLFGTANIKRFPAIVPDTKNSFDPIFTSWDNTDQAAHQEYLSRKV